MVHKTLFSLAAISQLCILVALRDRTASAAQIVLTPGNLVGNNLVGGSVIGGSGTYGGGGITTTYNDDTNGFAAGNIFSSQTPPISESAGSGFWLGPDNAPANSYITIDLGGSVDNLSQVELFNTHNAQYGDRGTGNFEILGGNSITLTSPGNYELTPGTTTVLVSGTLPAADPIEPTGGIPGETFDVSTGGGSFRYLAFVPLSVASFNTPCCGTNKTDPDATPTEFGLNELLVFTTPEPSSVVALVGLCGMGLVGFALRRKLAERAARVVSVAAILLAALVGFNSSLASAGTITTITNGDAGGGVVLNPAFVVYAVDIDGQQTSGSNVVQGVAFANSNPNVTDTVSTSPLPGAGSGTANSGSFPPAATFPMPYDTNSQNLLNIVQSLNYGVQHVVVGGLTPGSYYDLQLLISDGSNNPRIEDIAVNGATPDVLNVAVNEAYDASYFAMANGSGQIIVDLTPDTLSGDHNPVLNGLIVQAVPEPSSVVALIGCAAVGVALLVRRRRKS